MPRVWLQAGLSMARVWVGRLSSRHDVARSVARNDENLSKFGCRDRMSQEVSRENTLFFLTVQSNGINGAASYTFTYYPLLL